MAMFRVITEDTVLNEMLWELYTEDEKKSKLGIIVGAIKRMILTVLKWIRDTWNKFAARYRSNKMVASADRLFKSIGAKFSKQSRQLEMGNLSPNMVEKMYEEVKEDSLKVQNTGEKVVNVVKRQEESNQKEEAPKNQIPRRNGYEDKYYASERIGGKFNSKFKSKEQEESQEEKQATVPEGKKIQRANSLDDKIYAYDRIGKLKSRKQEPQQEPQKYEDEDEGKKIERKDRYEDLANAAGKGIKNGKNLKKPDEKTMVSPGKAQAWRHSMNKEVVVKVTFDDGRMYRQSFHLDGKMPTEREIMMSIASRTGKNSEICNRYAKQVMPTVKREFEKYEEEKKEASKGIKIKNVEVTEDNGRIKVLVSLNNGERYRKRFPIPKNKEEFNDLRDPIEEFAEDMVDDESANRELANEIGFRIKAIANV